MTKFIITEKQLDTILNENEVVIDEQLKTKIHEMSVICSNMWQIIESDNLKLPENYIQKLNMCHSELVNIARFISTGDINTNSNPNVDLNELIIGTN